MIIYFCVFIGTIIFYMCFCRKSKINFDREHFMITGGSSGIGLALAIQAAKIGVDITIIARSEERLQRAKKEISSAFQNSNQKILTFAVDVSDENVDLHAVVNEASNTIGPITMLVNCAGTSISCPFEESSLQDFRNMLNVNYIGSVNVTKAVLPLMKRQRKGRVVFVSSMAGLIGIYGYTSYSGSKFALLGLAESLQMEVKPYNINIMVSFPPDTDTPGFAEENKNKPLETARISESGGLYSAERVANKIIQDSMNNKFMSSVGFEGWMLCTLCSGCGPVNSLVDLVIQVFTMGLLRIVVYIYLKQCDRTVKNCAKEKEVLLQTT